jgi:hypothetical protein
MSDLVVVAFDAAEDAARLQAALSGARRIGSRRCLPRHHRVQRDRHQAAAAPETPI